MDKELVVRVTRVNPLRWKAEEQIILSICFALIRELNITEARIVFI